MRYHHILTNQRYVNFSWDTKDYLYTVRFSSSCIAYAMSHIINSVTSTSIEFEHTFDSKRP